MPELPVPEGRARPVVVGPLTGAPAGAADVEALAADAARADGGHPLSEDALLALRDGSEDTRHVLLVDGERLAGYAQLPGRGSAELLVAPAARGRGAGAALAAELERLADGSGAPLRVWSHGDSPAAAALARRRGYRRVRELQHQSRPLGAAAPLPPVDVPSDVHLRAFEVDRDEAAWLDLNSRAFADHPEQGRWTAADLDARLGEPWFDPAGLLLAVDSQDGRLLASHWTKRDPSAAGSPGEVYVVAVDPGAQGRGLGHAVVLAGLHHLDSAGCPSAGLYVEGDNAAALRLYARLGFRVDGVDALYERGGVGPGQG